MPEVPKSYERQVGVAPIDGSRLNVNVSPDAFGAAVGRGMENAGGSIHRVQLEQIQRANQIKKTELQNKEAELRQKLANAALQRRGKDAIGSMPEDTLAEYDKAIGEIDMEATNPWQKQEFRQRAAQGRLSLNQTIQGHVAHEAEVVDRDETYAGVEHRSNEAVASPFDAARLVAEQRDLIRQYAARNGKPQAWTDQEADKYASNTHLQVLTSLAASGDAQSAKTYHERFANEFKGKDSINALGIVNETVSREQSQRIGDSILLKIDAGEILTLSDARAAAKEAAGDNAVLREAALHQVEVEWNIRKASKAQEIGRYYTNADEMFSENFRVSDIDPGTFNQLTTEQKLGFYEMESQFAANKRPPNNSDSYYALRALAGVPSNRQAFLDIDLRELRADMSDSDYGKLVELQSDMRKDQTGSSKLQQGIYTQEQVINKLFGELDISPSPDKGNPDRERANDFRNQLNQAVIANQIATGKEATPEQVESIGKALIAEIEISTPRSWYNPARWLAGDDEQTVRFFEAPVPATDREKIVDALKEQGVTSPDDDQIKAIYHAKVMGRTRAK